MPRNVIIRLENALGVPARVVEVSAVVDTDVHHLYLPASIVRRLELHACDTRGVSASEGLVMQCRYVGPILLQVGHSKAFTGAVEFGDEVVLGNIALGHLGLKIDPVSNDLVADSTAARIGGFSLSVG